MRPAIAERWEISPDGRVYTFYIRKTARFHNGRRVRAEDVKYSFERQMRQNEDAAAWVFRPLSAPSNSCPAKPTRSPESRSWASRS